MIIADTIVRLHFLVSKTAPLKKIVDFNQNK